jgi:hypothetical protein
MLDNFMSPTVSWWDNYEELHFMQDGAPPYSVLPVGTQLESIFLVSGMSIKDQHNGLHKVLALPRVISFCCAGPKKYTDQNQEHLRNCNY